LNHTQGDSILDAPGRVQAFQFGIYRSIFVRVEPVYPDKRRIADRLQYILVYHCFAPSIDLA
jgi:hypothetical protein